MNLESTQYNLNRPGFSVSFLYSYLKGSHAGRPGHITGGDRIGDTVSAFQEAGLKGVISTPQTLTTTTLGGVTMATAKIPKIPDSQTPEVYAIFGKEE